jgi:hypothetical protein
LGGDKVVFRILINCEWHDTTHCTNHFVLW